MSYVPARDWLALSSSPSEKIFSTIKSWNIGLFRLHLQQQYIKIQFMNLLASEIDRYLKEVTSNIRTMAYLEYAISQLDILRQLIVVQIMCGSSKLQDRQEKPFNCKIRRYTIFSFGNGSKTWNALSFCDREQYQIIIGRINVDFSFSLIGRFFAGNRRGTSRRDSMNMTSPIRSITTKLMPSPR